MTIIRKTRRFEGRFFNTFAAISPELDYDLGGQIESKLIQQNFSPAFSDDKILLLKNIDVFLFIIGGKISIEELEKFIDLIIEINNFNSINKLYKQISIVNCNSDNEFYYLVNRILKLNIDSKKITIFKSKDDIITNFRREYLPYFKILEKIELNEQNTKRLNTLSGNSEIIKIIKAKIRKNEIEDTLDILSEKLQDESHSENAVILLSNRFFKLKNEITYGLISKEQENLEHNKLIMGLLDLLDKIK